MENYLRDDADDLQGVPSRRNDPGRKKGRTKDSMRGVPFCENEGSSGCMRKEQDLPGGAAEGDVIVQQSAVESYLEEFKKDKRHGEGGFDLMHYRKGEACGTVLRGRSGASSTESAEQVGVGEPRGAVVRHVHFDELKEGEEKLGEAFEQACEGGPEWNKFDQGVLSEIFGDEGVARREALLRGFGRTNMMMKLHREKGGVVG